jgi:protein required for attachment to host cells
MASSQWLLTPNSSILWILVADGKQARFFEHREEDRIAPAGTLGPGQYGYKKGVNTAVLAPLPEMNLRAEPLESYQINPEKHGAGDGSIPSHRHTRMPHGDTKDEIKQNFMRAIAARLEQASIGKRFDRLVIAAPPREMGELRALLNPHIRKHLVAEIPEELTRLSPHELLAHITKYFPRAVEG